MKLQTKLSLLLAILLLLSSCATGQISVPAPSETASIPPEAILTPVPEPPTVPPVKYYSVLGDSISTYPDSMPEGYALFYVPETLEKNGMHSINDMWWSIVGASLGARRLVNGAWSGSTVTGSYPGTCSEERVAELAKDGYAPDLILIYIGVNDFSMAVKIGKTNADDPDELCFATAYRLMLRRLKAQYPNAEILCGTLMRPRLPGHDEWDMPTKLGRDDYEDYNDAIRAVVRDEGCVLIDLAATGIKYEVKDGLHPTAQGHRDMADAWLACLNARA